MTVKPSSATGGRPRVVTVVLRDALRAEARWKIPPPPVIRHRWLNQTKVTPPDAAVWFWCAIGGLWLPGFRHTIIDCENSDVTPTGWIDFRNLDLFLELKCVYQQTCAFMSAVFKQNKTKQRQRKMMRKIVKSIANSCVVVFSCSALMRWARGRG